jgi:phosphosulfolactate synthase
MQHQPQQPQFLSTTQRPTKPRLSGVTHVLDKGSPLQHLQATLAASDAFVDVWKFGWGTAYLDIELTDKLAELDRHRVRACTGGTLLEIAWLQGRTSDFFDWVAEVGFPCVEVSNGATDLPLVEKRQLIATARARGLDVLSEVGSKNPLDHATPAQWADEIEGDLDAGALWVVAEGRESGTVGIYDAHGEVRRDVVEAIERHVDGTRVIYEAPRRNQQAWLICHLGPHVNLGNVRMDEIMGVESLRLGLRADTIGVGSTTRLPTLTDVLTDSATPAMQSGNRYEYGEAINVAMQVGHRHV